MLSSFSVFRINAPFWITEVVDCYCISSRSFYYAWDLAFQILHSSDF